jgi:putative transposase
VIRTHILPCRLPKAVADALNLESGRIYTQTLVAHYRVYRKTGHWLSAKAGEKLNDFYTQGTVPTMHAYSKDAAQQGFYKACVTAQALRKAGCLDARYPHRSKKFRTTIWKNTAIRRQADTLELSTGKGQSKIRIPLPAPLGEVLAFREARLVYDKKARRYTWHLVVENGKSPAPAPGDGVVSVDLGEIHPAVVGDEAQAVIITCRGRRHESQGHDKRLASLNAAIAHARPGSRRYRRLVRAKTRLKAKHKHVVRDMEHKISRAIVDVAVDRHADTIALGDVRDVAARVNLGTVNNRKVSSWNHGAIRRRVEYKAEAEGIRVELVDERHTTQTCPHCQHRHKPRGRVYRCPACRFQAHRDVVGQINILSRFRYGEVGKIPAPPEIVQRRPAAPPSTRSMRRRRDTGQPPRDGCRGCSLQPQEAAWL